MKEFFPQDQVLAIYSQFHSNTKKVCVKSWRIFVLLSTKLFFWFLRKNYVTLK